MTSILGPDGRPATSSITSIRQRPTQPKAFIGSEVWEAAKRNGYRGYFYFPTLEPSEMAPQETRAIIAAKAWWLYRNVDALGALIDGLAVEEVDTGIWPKAATSNRFFNKAVNDAFERECGRPDQFHAAEEESFYSMQVLIRRSIRLMGELFAQLLEPAGPGSMPAIHLISPWQCSNASTALDQSKWSEGIRYNRLGRALQFRFVTSPDRTSWVDVPRENVLHFHDQFLPGERRGVSSLARITRGLFRMQDIQKSEESGMLLRTRIAYAITKRDHDGDGPSIIPGAGDTEVIEQRDGTKIVVQKIVAGDTEVDVADLPLGYDFKVVESNRAQATPEWLRWMLYSAGLSTGYPPDYVFFLAGLGNGTDVRRVQKRIQRMKNSVRNFQLIKQFVPHWYEYWLYQRLKMGAFANVPGGIPEDFLRHKHILPADDTVDVGREGRLYDERFATARMAPSTYFGFQETDAEDVDDEWIDLRRSREDKLAAYNQERANAGLPPLTYEQQWPLNSSAQIVQAPAPDPASP